MRNLLHKFVVGSAIVAGVAASAQVYGPYNNRPYNDRDGRYDRSYRGERMDILGRVQSDIDRALSFPFRGGERRSLEHARRDLFDFQRDLSRGRFNKGHLDSAIEHLQKVVDHRRIPYELGSTLQNDANRLRDFRASRGGEGGYGYGYRR